MLITKKSELYQFLYDRFVVCMSIKGIFPIDKWDFESESILADLPVSDLEILMSRKSEQVYKKGQVIFREGAYPAGIYYIANGKVKKY